MYEPVSNMLKDFEGWVKKRMTEHSKRDSITISILPRPETGECIEKYQKQQSPTSVLKVPDRKSRCQQIPIR